MKNVLKICIILIILINSFCIAKSALVPDDIKIGLFYEKTAKSSVTLCSDGGIEIGTITEDGDFTLEDETGKKEKIVVSKGRKEGSVHIEGYGEIGSKTEYPYFRSKKSGGIYVINVDGTNYRGNIEIRRTDESDMTIINHLSMQEYLYGVVPREIGSGSPKEALKAQAISARTFATKNYKKRLSLGFNLTNSTDDQAYGGYDWEKSSSNEAVDETEGLVITYKGEPINAYFYSTSGGYTESPENVWVSSVPYLKSVPDTYEPFIEGNTTWEVTLTADEVKQCLKSKDIDVGDIVDLIPLERSEAGRVTSLKIVGTNGEKIITKLAVRTYFGLKSQWYTINSEAPKLPTDDDKQEEQKQKEEEEKKRLEEEQKQKEEDEKKRLEEEQKQKEEAEKKRLEEEQKQKEEDEKKRLEEEQKQKEEEEKKNKQENNTSGDNEDVLVINPNEPGTQNIVIAPKNSKNRVLKIIDAFSPSSISMDRGIVIIKNGYMAKSSNTVFVFRGRGWGHAVGMSQNGAKGMAQNGFTAEEILKWYYTGVEIEK
jgi:stage II sporulation protein D